MTHYLYQGVFLVFEDHWCEISYLRLLCKAQQKSTDKHFIQIFKLTDFELADHLFGRNRRFLLLYFNFSSFCSVIFINK